MWRAEIHFKELQVLYRGTASETPGIKPNFFVINLKERTDKLRKFTSAAATHMTRIDGVNLTKSEAPYLKAIRDGFHANVPLKTHGWVGVGLAHMNAWQIVSGMSNMAVIFEDDCRFKTEWHSNLLKHINALCAMDPGFDIFLLNVLRPKGKRVGSNILKIDNLVREKQPCPNVWLSCYALSPVGATKLLNLFRNMNADMNETQVDHLLIFGLFNSDIRAYCIDTTNLVVTHDENDSDKSKFNLMAAGR